MLITRFFRIEERGKIPGKSVTIFFIATGGKWRWRKISFKSFDLKPLLLSVRI